MVKPHSPAKGLADESTLMTDDQFENFWAGLLSCGRPFADRPANEADRDPREAAAQRGRSSKPTLQRCGTCRGCIASDCGSCKNCRDKPRFGGPGIKKKACLRRVCHKAKTPEDDDDDDDDDDDEASYETTSPTHAPAPTATSELHPPSKRPRASTSEPQSAVTSPTLRPSSPSDVPTGMDACDAYACRGPLALQSGSTAPSRPAHAMGSQLDVLSRMASSIGAT